MPTLDTFRFGVQGRLQKIKEADPDKQIESFHMALRYNPKTKSIVPALCITIAGETQEIVFTGPQFDAAIKAMTETKNSLPEANQQLMYDIDRDEV